MQYEEDEVLWKAEETSLPGVEGITLYESNGSYKFEIAGAGFTATTFIDEEDLCRLLNLKIPQD